MLDGIQDWEKLHRRIELDTELNPIPRRLLSPQLVISEEHIERLTPYAPVDGGGRILWGKLMTRIVLEWLEAHPKKS